MTEQKASQPRPTLCCVCVRVCAVRLRSSHGGGRNSTAPRKHTAYRIPSRKRHRDGRACLCCLQRRQETESAHIVPVFAQPSAPGRQGSHTGSHLCAAVLRVTRVRLPCCKPPSPAPFLAPSVRKRCAPRIGTHRKGHRTWDTAHTRHEHKARGARKRTHGRTRDRDSQSCGGGGGS